MIALVRGVTAASIFVDYQRASTGFTNDETMAEWDGVTSMWTLGATVSLYSDRSLPIACEHRDLPGNGLPTAR